MGQLFLIAFRNLAQHRKRTLLLGGAITGVTTLLVFLLCLSSGVHATMLESATTLMTGHINVAGFYKVTAGQSAPLVTDHKKVAAAVREILPDVDYIAARGRGWAKAVSETGSTQTGIGGIDIRNEPGFRKVIHVLEGNLDDLAKPNTLLIFEEQAKKLDVKVGDTVTMSAPTPRGVNNTVDVRVIAVAQSIGLLSSFNVYMPDETLRQLYQLNPDSTGALLVYLKDMKRIPKAKADLREGLKARGYLLMEDDSRAFWQKFEVVNREDWTGQKLDLTTWDEELSFLKYFASAVDWLMYILTTILLIIIAIGVMNAMWIAIRERTREVGTLRAIGMQRTRVLAMFVIEAFTLSILAAGVGVVLGLAVSGGFHAAHVHVPTGLRLFLMASTFKFAVEPARIATGVAIIAGCTTGIALIPAYLAARLKPITAMHHIG